MSIDAGHLRLVHRAGRVPAGGLGDNEPVYVPPHDLDAEAAVISALFIDESGVRRVDSFLRPEHFYAEAHRRIYEGILSVATPGYQPGEQGCIVRVGAWLKDRGRIEQIGGMSYLTEILNCAPFVANVERYAAIVYEKWRARQVIARCQEFAARGYLDYGETQEYADEAVRILTEIARRSIGGPIESNLEALKRIVRRIKESMSGDIASKRPMGIFTGFAGYDHETGGLHAGDKTVVAALPGVGKTAFALQIAVNVAAQGIGVLVFSNEMDRDSLLLRALAREARVDGRRSVRCTELEMRTSSRAGRVRSRFASQPPPLAPSRDPDGSRESSRSRFEALLAFVPNPGAGLFLQGLGRALSASPV